MEGDVVGGARRWVRDTTGKVSYPKITILSVIGMYTWHLRGGEGEGQ